MTDSQTDAHTRVCVCLETKQAYQPIMWVYAFVWTKRVCVCACAYIRSVCVCMRAKYVYVYACVWNCLCARLNRLQNALLFTVK